MKRFPIPELDYWPLRPKTWLQKEYRHIWLLLYWPLFGLLFSFVERYYVVPGYTPVYCALDDLIPFWEWAFLPYLYWFIYLAGAVVYAFFYDVRAFRQMMAFVMVTYTITIVIYLIWPTCQELRPVHFPRENLLTALIARFYAFDTNTNVCPSLHVIGSVAAMLMGLHAKRFQKPGWRIYFVMLCVMISLSTVFMKQHSILDVAAAVPVCIVGWVVAYVPGYLRAKAARPAAVQRKRPRKEGIRV